MRLVVALLVLASPPARAEGRIFVAGGDIPDRLQPSSLEGAWWALCKDALIKVRARVVIDRDSDGKPTGFRHLETLGCEEPLLLLRGFPFLRARTLTRVPAAVTHEAKPGLMTVKLDGRVVFHLKLLGAVEDVFGAEVVRAGDLDGDGKRDLVIDAHYHDIGTVRALLLSTAARPGEAVREVARVELPSNC